MKDYLTTTVPRHLRRSTLEEDEPDVVAAALLWCEMRNAGETRISFAQFFTDVLEGRLKSKQGIGAIQSFLRRHHGEVYRRATSRS